MSVASQAVVPEIEETQPVERQEGPTEQVGEQWQVVPYGASLQATVGYLLVAWYVTNGVCGLADIFWVICPSTNGGILVWLYRSATSIKVRQ
ncbi:UNVERIFIED_CONTAM: hypothetical protein K2H54_044569 [Gekko kuhli]